jgi:predicted  nucleic acid-binding Zn-ribbon protein
MDDITDEQPGRRERMGSRPWVRSAAMIGGGLVAGGILAGTLTANAATDDAASATSATSSYSQEADVPADGPGGGAVGNGDPSQPQRSDEELLTGDTATQVTDAVLAEYPDATIQRVETDSEGVYEAHIVTADDEQLIVQVGEDFSITGTQSH